MAPLRTSVAGLTMLSAAAGQDLFLASKLDAVASSLSLEDPISDPEASWPDWPGKDCPPLKWLKQDFGTGKWILNYTDKTWGKYMEFLHVAKEHWPEEFNTTDIHSYVFADNSFVMNHTIPLTGFHLLYEATTSGEWQKNPYPAPTPSGLDPHAKANLTRFRNVFERPGVPHRDSCWALRTDMYSAQVDPATNQTTTSLVSFWRELTSPIDMRVSLRIVDPNSGAVVEPWATQMPDARPFPGFSYRYFRKTVESFDDALRRLPCVPTGVRDGTYFC